jgi:hypothetical protein
MGDKPTEETDESKSLGDYIGHTYNYAKQIKGPPELGMKQDAPVATNVTGLYSYLSLLTSGVSLSSKRNPNSKGYGMPLGNKQFISTFVKCKDVDTDNEVDRYMYINNVPTGVLPGTTTSLGTYGIIPGIVENVGSMIPGGLVKEILGSGTVPCASVTLETIKSPKYGDDKYSEETRHVAIHELEQMYDKQQHRYTGTVETNEDGGDMNPKPGKAGFTEKQLIEWKKKAGEEGMSVGTTSELNELENKTAYSQYPRQRGYRQGDMVDQLLYLGEEYEREHSDNNAVMKMFDVTKPDGLMKVYLLGFVVLCSYMSMRMMYR